MKLENADLAVKLIRRIKELKRDIKSINSMTPTLEGEELDGNHYAKEMGLVLRDKGGYFAETRLSECDEVVVLSLSQVNKVKDVILTDLQLELTALQNQVINLE